MSKSTEQVSVIHQADCPRWCRSDHDAARSWHRGDLLTLTPNDNTEESLVTWVSGEPDHAAELVVMLGEETMTASPEDAIAFARGLFSVGMQALTVDDDGQACETQFTVHAPNGEIRVTLGVEDGAPTIEICDPASGVRTLSVEAALQLGYTLICACERTRI